MEEEYDKRYIEFASNIHFYEFLQEEFKEPHFKVEGYSDEIKELDKKTDWDVGPLSEFLREHPKSFEIFQEIFQLSRFTNTQLTHFLFDVRSLNSTDKKVLKSYLIKNLEKDNHFFKIFSNELKKNKIGINLDDLIKIINEDSNKFDSFVWIFKSAVFKYVLDCVKKNEILQQRLSSNEFKDASERTAKYLIENLKLNNTLKGVDIKEFLLNKRIAKDTKSIHGKFGSIKINQIFENHGIINADEAFNKLGIKEIKSNFNHAQLEQYSKKIIFVTEKSVERIIKRKDKKLKKFDFIILFDLKPIVLIETNFFTTAGTKIGINQGEYTDLKEDIEKISKDYSFLWITDGNYWLTSDGHSRLLNLYSYFGDQILNYNLFDKRLPELMRKIKQ